MMETESGKHVTKEYLKTGRTMRGFEQKVAFCYYLFLFHFRFISYVYVSL